MREDRSYPAWPSAPSAATAVGPLGRPSWPTSLNRLSCDSRRGRTALRSGAVTSSPAAMKARKTSTPSSDGRGSHPDRDAPPATAVLEDDAANCTGTAAASLVTPALTSTVNDPDKPASFAGTLTVMVSHIGNVAAAELRASPNAGGFADTYSLPPVAVASARNAWS